MRIFYFAATSTFGGGTAFGQAQPTAFGSTAFKPTGAFGLTSQPGSSSLFGSTTTSQAGGLFSQPATTGFGAGRPFHCPARQDSSLKIPP